MKKKKKSTPPPPEIIQSPSAINTNRFVFILQCAVLSALKQRQTSSHANHVRLVRTIQAVRERGKNHVRPAVGKITRTAERGGL